MALFCDRANGAAEFAVVVEVVVAPVAAAAVEAEVVRVVAVALAQRARPVVAELATVVDLRAGAVARSREKDTITVRTSDLLTTYAID